MDRRETAALIICVCAMLLAPALGLAREVGFTDLFQSPTKVLALVGALAVLAAVPLALLEARANRMFRDEEQRLRAERPFDTVAAYDGPDGDGLAFDGPLDRVVLVRARGGMSAPLVRVERHALPPDARSIPLEPLDAR